MAKSDKDVADELNAFFLSAAPDQIKDKELTDTELGQRDPHYDKVVRSIYKQAHRHRDLLIKFYIWYTVTFTAIVLLLLLVQAAVRVTGYDTKFEIMPQWTLDILVTGMFGQFIGLLKVVTQNAWNFKSFFDHHNDMRSSKGDDEDALVH